MIQKTLTKKLNQNVPVNFRTKRIRDEKTRKMIGLVLRDPNSNDIITRGKWPNGVDYRLIETSIDRKSGFYTIEKDPVSGKLKSEPPIYFPIL